MPALVLAAGIGPSLILRQRVERTLPTGVLTIIVVVYFFGLVDHLRLGIATAVAMVAVGVVTGIVLTSRNRRWHPALEAILTPGLAAFIALMLASRTATEGLRFAQWDEFSHWGLVAKATFATDSLTPFQEPLLTFASYPPGGAVWEYTVSTLLGRWQEGDVFWAYQILVLTLVLPLVAGLHWRRPSQVVPMLAAAFLVPVVLFDTYGVVLIDPLLGLAFGYCLVVAVESGSQGPRAWLHLLPGLAVLTMLKDTGTVFALIAVVCHLVVWVVRGRHPRTLRAWGARVGLMTVAIVGVRWPWEMVKRLRGLIDRFELDGDPAGLWQVITGSPDAQDYQIETTRTFVRTLWEPPIDQPLPLPLIGWLVILVVITAALETATHARRGPMRLRGLPVTITVGCGMIMYLVGMWAAYVSTFTVYEATRLAAFPRYSSTYLVAWVMLVVAMARRLIFRRPRRMALRESSRTLQLTALLLVLVSITPGVRVMDTPYGINSQRADEVRLDTDRLAARAAAAGVGSSDRVWFIDATSDGASYWRIRYELYPSQFAEDWAIAPSPGPDDHWKTAMSADEWQAELGEYQWVLILYADEDFIGSYRSLFTDPEAIANPSVFRVGEGADGRVELIPAG